jgi:hypothetical protein
VWPDWGKINGQSTQDSALVWAKALWSERGKLNEWGTQNWCSCICKEVWSEQGQLKSRSTGDCDPAYAYAAEMDLWKLNGQKTQISDIEQAEAGLSDRGK